MNTMGKYYIPYYFTVNTILYLKVFRHTEI